MASSRKLSAQNAANTIHILQNRKTNLKTKARYRKFGEYLEDKFGVKVYKITIDAGFSCPNRDGAISNSGCIFCDDSGSFSKLHSNLLPIKEQVKNAIDTLPKRYRAEAFFAYFQAFSNTYGTLAQLKSAYDSAFCDKRVVGITIGTRPDCVDIEKMKLISSYPNPWIEYGLQTVHDITLKRINRGHNFKTFLNAYELAKENGVKVCVHIILGLPGENYEMMIETAKSLSKLEPDGVKFHALTVLKGAPLYLKYLKNPIPLLSENEYCNILCDFLEILPPKTVIQRTAGTGLVSELVAPLWVKNKFKTQNKIDRILKERNSYQGARQMS